MKYLPLLILLFAAPAAARAQSDPFANFTREWRDSPEWRDKMEVAVYDVTRIVDGKELHHEATIVTHKELADPVTKTRSLTGQGREAFKQLRREDTGRERTATMVYVGAADMKSLKLDTSVQDEGGSGFKQYINHKGTLTWEQFSYLPGEGHKSGTYSPPADFVFHEALGLVLRGHPFDQSPQPITVRLLLPQVSVGFARADPAESWVHTEGVESIKLPFGTVNARHLVLHTKVSETSIDGKSGRLVISSGCEEEHLWFATDAKLLCVLVQQVSGEGRRTFRLKALERKDLEPVKLPASRPAGP